MRRCTKYMTFNCQKKYQSEAGNMSKIVSSLTNATTIKPISCLMNIIVKTKKKSTMIMNHILKSIAISWHQHKILFSDMGILTVCTPLVQVGLPKKYPVFVRCIE